MSGSNGLKREHLAVLNQLIRFGARGFDRLSVPRPRFEFAAVVFRYEGVCLASENPQLLIIQLIAGP